jgi:hypothetical protein
MEVLSNKFRRLNNYSIALCLYFLRDKYITPKTNVSSQDILSCLYFDPYLPDSDILLKEDLFHYFDVLRSCLETNLKLFNVEYNGLCCIVRVTRGYEEKLEQCLNNYVNALIEDELDSSENRFSWQKELKVFINKVKKSEFNLKSYNVAIEDMHVVLYGVLLKKFKLNRFEITPAEHFENFGTRTPEGLVACGDGSKFFEQLNVSCNIDLQTYINNLNKKNVNKSSAFTSQEDWLYKYICDKTGYTSSSIPMQFELIDPDQSKPNTFKNFDSLKQAYHRLNKRYEKKYGVKNFIKKVKNEDLFRITFAKNDTKRKAL